MKTCVVVAGDTYQVVFLMVLRSKLYKKFIRFWNLLEAEDFVEFGDAESPHPVGMIYF